MIPPIRHYWIDDLDPWVFRFFGNVGIRWYGVAYVVGIAFAGYVLQVGAAETSSHRHSMAMRPPYRPAHLVWLL
jgi:prolipoprotein diacylglyceryltransferase